jgi:hypothetical protein
VRIHQLTKVQGKLILQNARAAMPIGLVVKLVRQYVLSGPAFKRSLRCFPTRFYATSFHRLEIKSES